MAKFKYIAIDQNGNEKKGRIEAGSPEEANAKLVAQGLMVSEVSEAASAPKVKAKGGEAKQKSKKKSFSFGAPINQEGLTIFTRQLSTLLRAGLPLVRAIDVMAKQEKRAAFKNILLDLSDTVRSGSPFSDGLLHHPKVFNHLYINMVRAGEAGGVLDVVLNRLAYFMEKSLKTKKKVKSAMVYPVVVICVAILIVILLMVVVVPKFQEIFRDMLKGAKLPALTQFVIDVSNFIKTNILLTIAIAVVLFFGARFLAGTQGGRRFLDKVFLKLPKLGDLLTKAIIARFTRTFGTLLGSGVPILQALTITRDVVENSVYAHAIDKVHNNVRDGEPMAVSMEREDVFPSMVTSMIDVGEEAGDMPEMLNQIADNYDDDVDNAVAGITSIIEPVMIVFLAVVVGVIVIALFLPIIEIIKGIQ